MARVVVYTDDGREVWSMGEILPWHVASIINGRFTNTVCRNLTSGLQRAIEDAAKIQRGVDPERPSEKVMRMLEQERLLEQER